MTTTDLGGRAAPPAAGPGAGQLRRGRGRLGAGGAPGGGGIAPYLFLAPYLILFGLFVLAPSVYVIWISLHDWDFLLPGKPFVGLQNYLNLFKSGTVTSGPFWQSMTATGKFVLYSVPLLVAIPLAVAVMLNQKFPGRNFFRAAFFAPYVLGVAVIGILWRFLLDPNIGLVNHTLDRIGIDANVPWTTQTPWVWAALVGPTVWWTLGFNTVIYLAGLQDIPRELYEAAKVDGASRWQQFRNVTLPGLRPVLVFVITITILASANVFGQPFLITQGRPGFETRSAIMYIGQEGLRDFRMGNAAAMSFLLTLVLMLISVANFVLFRERREG
jgi:multiple sugar transport system permease protein